MLSPGLSQAAEWSLAGKVKQSLGYDDNVRMREDAQGSFEYKIIPELTFLHKTDVSEIQANASYGTQIYTEIPQFNQDIQRYGLGGLYKTERFDWGLSTGFTVTPSRNTALQDSSFNGFNTNSSKQTWSVSPSLSYKIDELNSLVLTPAYSETTFTDTSSGDDSSTFRNNNSTNVNLAWQRLWTERYSSVVSFFYSNFDSQRGNNQGSATQTTNDSVGINFSNTYAWSENWELMGTVGARHAETSNSGVSSSSFGFLANIGVNYTGESFSSGINFRRSLVPSNQGQLQEQTSLGLDFNYNIVERLTANLAAGFQQSTQVNSIDQRTRENITIEPSINWQITPEWTFIGSYRYRTRSQDGGQDSASSNTTADSNLFMLTINYNWQGLSISR